MGKYLVIVSLIYYVSLILFTLIKVRLNKITVSFLLYLTSMLIWSLGSLFLVLRSSPGVLFWETFMLYGSTSFVFTFYLFLLEYLGSKKIRIKTIFALIVVLFLWVINYNHLIVTTIYIDENHNPIYKTGVGAYVFLFFGAGYFLFCFYEIFKTVKDNRILWKKVNLIFIALCLMIIVMILNLTKIGQSPMNIYMRIINGLLIAYSFYRYRFLNITLKVKKGIMHTIFAIIVGICLSYIIILVPSPYEKIASVFFIILILFPPIQRWYLHILNKIALGRMYEIRELYKDYVNEIGKIVKRKELTGKLVNILAKAFRIKNVAVYLINKEEKVYELSSSISDSKDKKFPDMIDANDFLIQELKFRKEIMLTEDILTLHKNNKNAKFDSIEFISEKSIEVVAPMIKDDDVIGFALLSDKTSADPYTRDDLIMINDFVNASLVCLDNSYMYEEIEKLSIRTISSGTTILNHALKNHVSMISACLSNITKEYNKNNMEVSEEFGIINNSTQHLMKIVQKIRETTKEINISKSRCNAQSIIENVINILKKEIDKKNIHIKLNCPDQIEINCDSTHIEETLINIIKNSVEAFDSQKKDNQIEIEIVENVYDVSISIKDNAKGMSEEEVRNVFEPFYSTKKTKQNFGLGLTYCYNVIKKHNGKIEISSTPGKGTKVKIILGK